MLKLFLHESGEWSGGKLQHHVAGFKRTGVDYQFTSLADVCDHPCCMLVVIAVSPLKSQTH